MTDLLTFRNTIATRVGVEVATLKESRTHGGRVSVDEVRRWAMLSPCARTAIVGVPAAAYEGGQVVLKPLVGVYLVTSGTSQQGRDAGALALVNQLMKVIPGNRWTITDAKAPDTTTIRADNLYTAQIDQLGVALWAVTWRQSIDLDLIDLNTLDDFTKLVATYDVGGADGDNTSQQIDL